jgi:hypothetical protein
MRLAPRESTVTTLRADARPSPIGFRDRSVDILQDALRRKHPRLLRNSPQLARELIVRRFANHRPQLYGIMAEAVFIDRHPDWGYVKSPNAPQHDVYRWVNRRRAPETGQIKFHGSGNPATYARDMLSDYRSDRFFIPDDHIASTRAYLKDSAERYSAAGDQVRANAAWRNYGRIRPIGTPSTDIAAQTRVAQLTVVQEKRAAYTSLGTALTLSLAPTAWDWANGDLAANVAVYRLSRALSLLGVSVGADLLLRDIFQGTLRGTIRGNAIIGTALTITDVTWLLYGHGWGRAFYQPDFYEQVIGGTSGLAIGLAAGSYAALVTSELGPFPAAVSGIVAATVAGTVGYLGGRSAAQMVCELLWPDLIHQQQRHQIKTIRTAIAEGIREAQDWPSK